MQRTQQPVVMEYMTEHLTGQVYQELAQVISPLRLFQHHALLKTTVKDYVRESQVRLILQPIWRLVPMGDSWRPETLMARPAYGKFQTVGSS